MLDINTRAKSLIQGLASLSGLWGAVCAALLILALSLAAVVVGVLPTWEVAFRTAGAICQFLGIIVGVYGIEGARQALDKPSAWTRARGWLNKTFGRRPKATVLEVHGSIQGQSVAGVRLSVWTTPGPDASLGERIELLERNLVSLREDSEHRLSQVNDRIEKLGSRLSQQASERLADRTEIVGKLEAVAIGDIHLQAAGFVVLGIGVLLATFSSELGQLFSMN